MSYSTLPMSRSANVGVGGYSQGLLEFKHAMFEHIL